MSDKELEAYIKKVEPNFNSHIEKGTIEMSNEYYNLLEERIRRLMDENNQLKENNQAMQEEMCRTWEKLNIIKELRNWLEEYFKGMTIDDIPIDAFYKKGMFRMNEYTLDKLNELEGNNE